MPKIAKTIEIKPFSLNSLPTLGPTISTLLISYVPVFFKVSLAISPKSVFRSFDAFLTLIITSSMAPNLVIVAPLKILFLFNASLIFDIGASFSYLT